MARWRRCATRSRRGGGWPRARGWPRAHGRRRAGDGRRGGGRRGGYGCLNRCAACVGMNEGRNAREKPTGPEMKAADCG